MELTNDTGDLEYQMEVEISSNAVNARGKSPKKYICMVKERDKPPHIEKPDTDDDILDLEDCDLNEEEIEDELDDEEGEEEDDEESIEESQITSEFSSGAFLILKADVRKSIGEPPLWKIDGKALVKKYIPFIHEGKTLYRNTSCYCGWNTDLKKHYYPATVVTLNETPKEHVVEFKKDLIPKEELEMNEECTKDKINGSRGQLIDDDCESLEEGEVHNEEMCVESSDGDENRIKMEDSSARDEYFTNGSFLILKSDAAFEKRPSAIWKIEDNLLQKYVPSEVDDGQMLFKSTNMFYGWSVERKTYYYPAAIEPLEESNKKHVELKNVIWVK